MKNKIILSIILLIIQSFNLNALAATPPVAIVFNTKVKSINNSFIKVEIIKPNKIQSNWDIIAANYNGCILDGEIEKLNARVNIRFKEIQCKNKSVNKVKGLAISSDDMRVGLKNDPKVGTSISVLIIDYYEK